MMGARDGWRDGCRANLGLVDLYFFRRPGQMLADDSSKNALVDLIPNQLAGENAPTGFRSFSTHVLQAFLTIERGVRIDDQSLRAQDGSDRARQLTADRRSVAVPSPARRSLRLRASPRRSRPGWPTYRRRHREPY